MNLGEGLLPHGTAEREAVVIVLLGAVRDVLAGEQACRAEALDWMRSSEADELCHLVGVPPRGLIDRLVELLNDEPKLEEIRTLLKRRRPADIYRVLMAA